MMDMNVTWIAKMANQTPWPENVGPKVYEALSVNGEDIILPGLIMLVGLMGAWLCHLRAKIKHMEKEPVEVPQPKPFAGNIVQFLAVENQLVALADTGDRFLVTPTPQQVHNQLTIALHRNELIEALNTPLPQAPQGPAERRKERPGYESSIPGSVLRTCPAPTCTVVIHSEKGVPSLTRAYGGGARLEIKAIKGKTFLYTATHVLTDVRNSAIKALEAKDGYKPSKLKPEDASIYIRANGKDMLLSPEWKVRAASIDFDFTLIEIPTHIWTRLGVTKTKMSLNHSPKKAIQITHIDRLGGSKVALGHMSTACPSRPGFLCHTASSQPGSSGNPILSLDGRWCYGVHCLGASATSRNQLGLNEFSSTVYLDPQRVTFNSRAETPWEEKLLRLMGRQEFEDYMIHLEEQDEHEEYYGSQQEAEYFNDLYDDAEYYTLRFFEDNGQYNTTIYAKSREMLTQAQYNESVLENRFSYENDDQQESSIQVLDSHSKRAEQLATQQRQYAADKEAAKLTLQASQAELAMVKEQQQKLLETVTLLKAELVEKHQERQSIIAKKKEACRKAMEAQSHLQNLRKKEVERKRLIKEQELAYALELKRAEQACSEQEAFAIAVQAEHTYTADPENGCATNQDPTRGDQSTLPMQEPVSLVEDQSTLLAQEPVITSVTVLPAIQEEEKLKQPESAPSVSQPSSLFRAGPAPGPGPTKLRRQRGRKSKLSSNTKTSHNQNGKILRRPPLPRCAKSDESPPHSTTNPQKSRTSPISGLKA